MSNKTSSREWFVAIVGALLLPIVVLPAPVDARGADAGTSSASTSAGDEGAQGPAEWCEAVPGDDWCEEWVATDLSGGQFMEAVLSPAGDQLYVLALRSERPEGAISSNYIIVTAAYDTADGDPVWAAEYEIGTGVLPPREIAVSPDGRTVYVSGVQEGDVPPHNREFVTIAYNTVPPEAMGDPQIGEQLWAATFGPTVNHPKGMAVSPDGSTVLVVGEAVIAYDAATGEELWHSTPFPRGLVQGVAAPFSGEDIALSSDGTVAYVTGSWSAPGARVGDPLSGTEFLATDIQDIVTVAYEVSGESAGEERWVAEYDGEQTSDQGYHISLSEDGDRVFVAGTSLEKNTPTRFVTLAYQAVSGEGLWVTEYAGGPGNNRPVSKISGNGLAVSPTNDLVFVAGVAADASQECSACRIAVLAYDQVSGDLRWSSMYAGAGKPKIAADLAVSRNGARVFVDGWDSGERLTLAYDSNTGRPEGIARVANNTNVLGAVLPSPDDARVYVVRDVDNGESRSAGVGITSYLMPQRADLSLSLAHWPGSVTAGEPMAYTFAVSNGGPDAAWGARLSVVLDDSVDAVSARSAEGDCMIADAHMVICDLGTVGTERASSVEVVVAPRQPGTFLASARASASSQDPDRDNNDMTVVLKATP